VTADIEARAVETAGGPDPRPDSTSDRISHPGGVDRARVASAVALTVLVACCAAAAISLHRNGHTQGDDFALYLRQARSLVDGDIAEVVADNRFAVLNTNYAFSPTAYPWGWPILLAPFVQLWGLDYDNLKFVVVGALAMWMVLLHGIVRRREGRIAAIAVSAVTASAPLYLVHTDHLLSEFPHALAVAIFVWWLDRVRRRHPWTSATTAELIVLGALGAVAYNVRRESLVLIGAIAVAQLVDAVGLARRAGRRVLQAGGMVTRLATPHLAFVATIALSQLLLPSDLFPENNGGAEFVGRRIGDYTGTLTRHLGLGRHPALGVILLAVAAIGVVIGCRRRPHLDAPLATVMVLSAIAVSTHFRMVDRYYFQVTPLVAYFVVTAVLTAVRAIVSLVAARPPTTRMSNVVTAVTVAPLAALVIAHGVVLASDIGDAREYDASGAVQIGPTHPTFVPIYEAVERETPPDEVVAYFRARTMTLLTDRRSFQTTSLDDVIQRADWFAQRKRSTYSQPTPTEAEAEALGFVLVWENLDWLLWRVDRPGG